MVSLILNIFSKYIGSCTSLQFQCNLHNSKVHNQTIVFNRRLLFNFYCDVTYYNLLTLGVKYFVSAPTKRMHMINIIIGFSKPNTVYFTNFETYIFQIVDDIFV